MSRAVLEKRGISIQSIYDLFERSNGIHCLWDIQNILPHCGLGASHGNTEKLSPFLKRVGYVEGSMHFNTFLGLVIMMVEADCFTLRQRGDTSAVSATEELWDLWQEGQGGIPLDNVRDTLSLFDITLDESSLPSKVEFLTERHLEVMFQDNNVDATSETFGGLKAESFDDGLAQSPIMLFPERGNRGTHTHRRVSVSPTRLQERLDNIIGPESSMAPKSPLPSKMAQVECLQMSDSGVFEMTPLLVDPEKARPFIGESHPMKVMKAKKKKAPKPYEYKPLSMETRNKPQHVNPDSMPEQIRSWVQGARLRVERCDEEKKVNTPKYTDTSTGAVEKPALERRSPLDFFYNRAKGSRKGIAEVPYSGMRFNVAAAYALREQTAEEEEPSTCPLSGRRMYGVYEAAVPRTTRTTPTPRPSSGPQTRFLMCKRCRSRFSTEDEFCSKCGKKLL